MARDARGNAPSGLIVVDKPGGMTSHDVVARIRRLAGTRRVGHAGTLDPMATGVLVVGVEKATRLLGHLTLTEKEYQATIRLGQATDTGDAEGTITSARPAGQVTLAQVQAAAAALTGPIQQVPPAVSAIKVGGRRAYQLAREGAPPVLAPRPVTVARSRESMTATPTGYTISASACCATATARQTAFKTRSASPRPGCLNCGNRTNYARGCMPSPATKRSGDSGNEVAKHQPPNCLTSCLMSLAPTPWPHAPNSPI